MLGNGGAMALGCGQVGAGQIKGAVSAWKVLAVDEAIDTAAARKGLGEEVYGGAAGFLVEPAGGGQHAVAQGFEFKPSAVHMAHQTIVGIGCCGRGVFALLAVGGGENYFFVEFFHGPAIAHDRGGEMVEQGLVGGRIASQAEIAGSADNGLTDMQEPHAVGHDAGSEGVVFGGDGLGQLGATGALGERLAV